MTVIFPEFRVDYHVGRWARIAKVRVEVTASFHKRHLGVRLAQTPDDLLACQRLRHSCFFHASGVDADAYDPLCLHVMVGGEVGLVGTARVMLLPDGQHLSASYTASAYDLAPLSTYPRPVMEVGRFCSAPGTAVDVLRLAWGALTGLVDAHGVGLLIGCSSFAGADPARHAASLALLGAHHRGPAALTPGRRAARTVPLAGAVSDRRAALAGLPPLLRSYLRLGGWVGDHAVVDEVMDTVHVFTALKVDAVPAARARALRALAG
ncbi:GNAT family N-acetyltransferase [Loktanella sp. DJP18]|uniref:GNAT family N-acetyltransferase n=1 Tax=Loktanella sp. DJP18 TaxID=3409788 RepID=UPI003BB5D677